MKINNKTVDLSKIKIPVLTVVATWNDLVSPEASLGLNGHISSKDEEIIKFQGGHVGLCISKKAQKTLWP